MKSHSEVSHEVLVYGAQESGNFSIAANGKAFKILIDGLYSNKIQAIIRELSSNAFDAQVAAGRPNIQFEIQAPNLLDPTFAIRDYGTSLSHANIMGLYTTVFQSTKEDSNLSVGKFGLGSKTPFAYTDNFTVTAFMKGTKRVYSAYINIEGIPQISLMASEDTDELDGLMVSFPVNSKDIETFRKEIAVVLEGFDILPIIKGAIIEPNSNGEIIREGSCFKIFKKKSYKDNYGPRAKQGCVIYPLDRKNLPDNLSQKCKNILDTNIIINFDIGELDITPSRETLSYDETTINNIINKLEAIDDEIIKDLKEEYAKVRTFYEATLFYNKIDDDMESTPSSSNFKSSLTFNGRHVKNNFSVNRDRFKRNYNTKVTYFTNYDLRVKNLRFKEGTYSSNFSLYEETMIVVERLGANGDGKIKGASERIKHSLGKYKQVLWIKDYGASPKQWRKFLKFLGYPPVIYEMDKLDRPAKVYNAPVERIARDEIRVHQATKGVPAWDEKVIDLRSINGSDYRYVISYNKGFIIDIGKIEDIHLDHYFDDLSKIFIINRRQKDKIEKYGVKSGIPDAEAKLAKEFDFEAYKKYMLLSKTFDHHVKDWAEELLGVDYDNDSSFKELLEHLKIYKNGYGADKSNFLKYTMWKTIATMDQVVEYEKQLVADPNQIMITLESIMDKFNKEYPMTKYFFKKYVDMSKTTINDIVDYIKTIDKLKEKELEVNV